MLPKALNSKVANLILQLFSVAFVRTVPYLQQTFFFTIVNKYPRKYFLVISGIIAPRGRNGTKYSRVDQVKFVEDSLQKL